MCVCCLAAVITQLLAGDCTYDGPVAQTESEVVAASCAAPPTGF